MDWLVDNTAREIEALSYLNTNLDGFFDKECVTVIREQREPLDKIQERRRQKRQTRRINESNDRRIVRVYYEDDKKYPSLFAQRC